MFSVSFCLWGFFVMFQSRCALAQTGLKTLKTPCDDNFKTSQLHLVKVLFQVYPLEIFLDTWEDKSVKKGTPDLSSHFFNCAAPCG